MSQVLDTGLRVCFNGGMEATTTTIKTGFGVRAETVNGDITGIVHQVWADGLTIWNGMRRIFVPTAKLTSPVEVLDRSERA